MSAVPAVLLHPLASTPAQHLRPKEVGHEGTGRACAPWLIARGRSLDVPRLDRVALHLSSFGSDAASARFATILVELGIANPSDWEACAGEPAKFLRRTLDRFVRSHGESEIDEAFELSVTLSTDPHEWCESEDEPDGSQIFLCVEASSCGFVNLAPALALCENELPRLRRPRRGRAHLNSRRQLRTRGGWRGACGATGSQQDSASLHETKATGRQGPEGHAV